MNQDPPTVIQNGYSDGGPVSPSIGKNTVIGALGGAFLAIAVIVISYLFNDTIIDADDVEKKLGMNVLGSLPLEESEYDGEKTKKELTKKSGKAGKRGRK